MKLKLFSRGGGKTALAIKESSQNQIPIVCYNDKAAEMLRERAKKEGFSIPKPISIHRLIETDDPPPKVIVDNLDHCFFHLIPQVEVVMATATVN